jgi:hypothetical protein
LAVFCFVVLTVWGLLLIEGLLTGDIDSNFLAKSLTLGFESLLLVLLALDVLGFCSDVIV